MNRLLTSIHILGIRVTVSPKEEILGFIKNTFTVPKKPHSSSLPRHQAGRIPHPSVLTIVTPNPEQIVLAQSDKAFAKILNEADVAIPDGIGLVLAARFLGFSHSRITHHPSLTRIPGVEFMEELVGLAARNGWPVALIGGRGGVAEEALLRLKKKYPGLVGWAEEPEFFLQSRDDQSNYELGIRNKEGKQDVSTSPFILHNSKFEIRSQGNGEDSIGGLASRILENGTRIVFVGLGAPKQEYFIARLARECQMSNVKCQIVLMAVGGSFDTIAGRTPRAPRAVQVARLEWLWRLFREPWRFRRQIALLKFLWLVVCKKLA